MTGKESQHDLLYFQSLPNLPLPFIRKSDMTFKPILRNQVPVIMIMISMTIDDDDSTFYDDDNKMTKNLYANMITFIQNIQLLGTIIDMGRHG